MKRKILFLLSGPPGCGKSTWAAKEVEHFGGEIISRDKIRFSLLEERGGDYFDYEDEVIARFLSNTQKAIDDPTIERVYIDATHINRKARDAVMNKLDLSAVDEKNCVFFDICSGVAIERNEKRTGLAHVPRSVVRRMSLSHTIPDKDESFDNVIFIDEFGKAVMKKWQSS
jgi:predicted kinase